MRKRVFVVALGESTFDLIEPWAAAGHLPVLASLMRGGTHGRMRSQVPLMTPQLWGSIVTGRTPGHHGAFDFWQRSPKGAFHAIDGSALRCPTLWEMLSRRGVPCGIVNLPFTYPPAAIDGFVIAGEDAPGAHRSIAHPPELYDEITEKFGRYRLKDIFPGGRQKTDYLTLIDEDVAAQTEVFEHLFRTRPWRFGMAFFSATAIAQHYFWRDMAEATPGDPFADVVLTAYRAVDRALGRLLEAVGPDTTVFVISDCGAGPLRSGVQINTILEQHGFLARKAAKPKAGRRLVAGARKQAQALLQRHLPDRLYYQVNHRLGGLKTKVQSYLAQSDLDWPRTQVFSRGKEGDLFVNLKGRDPHGIVEPGADYEAVRDRLSETFMALRDPSTGEPAVERVYRREELFQGPMLEHAPDMVVLWKDTAYMPSEDDRNRDQVFVERWREYMNWPTSGSHRVDAVLIAKGPGVAEGRTIMTARLIDLAPTWLHALGQDVPAELEGRVMQELFTAATVPAA
ncbi:MAG: alkaline phosphatase family protein [Geminicoccaceae bacterium]|nr:alkaline phosphatase family protein [Geminicoccaceae bacterium]MCB9968689.1 alkaline phosphatase family protein [Geminicoccaceae bacterium]HRY24787.1 alkaline phosphatase family protein [Geminicoccaceae bacterium]